MHVGLYKGKVWIYLYSPKTLFFPLKAFKTIDEQKNESMAKV